MILAILLGPLVYLLQKTFKLVDFPIFKLQAYRVRDEDYSRLRVVRTKFVTRLTRRVPLVEQELLTLQEHLSTPRFLVGFVLLDL